MKVSDDIGVATFIIFDRDVQQILNTTASEFLHTQNANKVDIPSILYTICKHTFNFEIKLTIGRKDFKPIPSQGLLSQKISFSMILFSKKLNK